PPRLTAEQFWYLLLSLPISGSRLPLNSLVAQPFGMVIAQAVPIPLDLETRRLGVLLCGSLVLGVVCFGAATLYRSNAEVCWLLLFAVAYVGAYCVLHPAMFTWYLVPPLAVLLLAFMVGVGAALQALPWRHRQEVAGAVGLGVIALSVVQ